MAKKSFAERALAKQRTGAKKALQKSGNSNEWTPTIGTHRMRILPPLNFAADTFNRSGELVGEKGEEDTFFYMTHGYHFFEGISAEGKGKMLWTPRSFKVDGKDVKDPIDEVVSSMYDTARAEKDDKLKSYAGNIKRKRQFFMNIILYTEDGPVYKILKDTTNEGKLISQICKNMGFPFYRDVQDEWVVEASLEIDEDQEIVDLVDVEVGHDFKIKKVKTGEDNWNFTYDTSIPVKKERALTEDELKTFMDQRVDLRNYVSYCEFSEADESLELYLDKIGFGDDSDEDDEDDEENVVQMAKKETKSKPKTSKKRPEPVDEDDDEDFDEDLLDDLDDDDED